MPDKTGRFTPQERAMLPVYVETGSLEAAGRAAGYAHPAKSAANALRRPAVAAEVDRLGFARILDVTLPKALGRLEESLDKLPVASPNLQTAIKTTLQYAREAFASTGGSKEPNQMSLAELDAEIRALELRAARMSAIDVEDQAGVFE